MKTTRTTASNDVLYTDDFLEIVTGGPSVGMPILSWTDRSLTETGTFPADFGRLPLGLRNPFVPFVATPDSTPSACLDPGLRPIVSSLGEKNLPLSGWLSLASRLCHALADLNEARLIYARINPSTVWVDEELRDVRLLPFQPFRERQLLSPDERRNLFERYPKEFLPAIQGTQPFIMDQNVDLFGAGRLLQWLLDHRHSLQKTGSSGRALPSIVTLILDRMLGRGADRYETLRGAAFDLDECAELEKQTAHIPEFQLGRYDGAPSLSLPQTLIARTGELERIRDELRRARTTARIVFVAGAPGTGKTATVEAFGREVANSIGVLVKGKSDQINSKQPLQSLSHAIEAMVDWILKRSERERRVWRRRLDAALEGNQSIAYILAPGLSRILGPAEGVVELPPQETRNRFLYTIGKLIRAFCRPNRPFCIFLDDMQWADEATIELLTQLASDRKLKGLLLIGAFRTDDTASDNALKLALKSFSVVDTEVLLIETANFDLATTATFISALLECVVDEGSPLARTTFGITKGNPFFILQFLQMAILQRKIVFDFVQNRWRWDEPEFWNIDLHGDAVAMVVRRLRNLSDECQNMLVHATILGTEFSLQTLQVALGDESSHAQLHSSVREAIAEGVLISQSAKTTNLSSNTRLRFAHDRIQQASVESYAEGGFENLRRVVALRLLDDADTREDLETRAIALTGLDALDVSTVEQSRRFDLAALNLDAGRDASAKLAFSAALKRFEAGLGWLPEDAWQANRPLARELSLACFRAAYQEGHHRRADSLYTKMIARTEDPLDLAHLIQIRVLLDTAAKDYDGAVRAARDALSRLGAALPSSIGPGKLVYEASLLWRNMRGRSTASIGSLPRCEDARIERAIATLTDLLPVGYFTDPTLLLFCGLRIANLSIRHGNAPTSASGYVIVGLALVTFDRFEAGHSWGQVAVDLARNEADQAILAKTLVIFAGFVNFWRQPFASSVEMIEEALAASLNAGDHQYASYCHFLRWQIGYVECKPLGNLVADMDRHSHFIGIRGDPFEIHSLKIWMRSFLHLTGDHKRLAAESPESHGDYHAELEKIGNRTLIAYHLVMWGKLDCLFGHYETALEKLDKAQRMRRNLPGHIAVVDGEFFRGVAAAKIISKGRGDRSHHRRLTQSVNRLQLRAQNAPENFTARFLYLQAESAAAKGAPDKAIKLLEQAIDEANDKGFSDVSALAADRAGELATAMGLPKRISDAYSEDSMKSFRDWGSAALVATDTPKDAPKTDAAVNAITARDNTQEIVLSEAHQLVPGAVAHSLATEGEAERRIEMVLRAALLESGFDCGCFVVFEGGLRRTLASHEIASDERDKTTPFRPRGDVLDLAQRRARELVVADIAEDPRFSRNADDPTEALARAIVCVPALSDGIVVGALYLADPRRRRIQPETLEALRIAARELYSAYARSRAKRDLADRGRALKAAEQRIVELDHERAELASFVPKSLGLPGIGMAGRGNERDNQRNLEQQEATVSTMFLDVQSFTVLVEHFGPDRVRDAIEQRFSAFYDVIVRYQGELVTTLGDAIFAVFEDEDDKSHATNAVRAALELGEIAREMNINQSPDMPVMIINVGINSGPALLAFSEFGHGANRRRTVTVVGSSVNVASRIASLARDGALLVGADTQRLLPKSFRSQSIGRKILKNVSQPKEIFDIADDQVDIHAEPAVYLPAD